MNTNNSTEVRQAAELMALHARIEALETALRKIAEWPPSSRTDDIIGAFIDAKLFARAALDKDARK